MKEKEKLNSIDLIDEKFIEEAAPYNAKPMFAARSRMIKRAVLIAACVALMLSAVIVLFGFLNQAIVTPGKTSGFGNTGVNLNQSNVFAVKSGVTLEHFHNCHMNHLCIKDKSPRNINSLRTKNRGTTSVCLCFTTKTSVSIKYSTAITGLPETAYTGYKALRCSANGMYWGKTCHRLAPTVGSLKYR